MLDIVTRHGKQLWGGMRGAMARDNGKQKKKTPGRRNRKRKP